MRRLFLFRITTIIVAIISLSACSLVNKQADNSRQQSLSIGLWNLQCMFDGIDNGSEYAEYVSSKGWDEAKYQSRLAQFAKALAAMNADILAFTEIENASVVRSLGETAELSSQGFYHLAFSTNPGASLGVGLLSKYPITKQFSHSISVSGMDSPRPMLEIWLKPADTPLVLLLCHWKSKLGGDAETEIRRRVAAKLAARRIKEIEAEFPGMPVMLLGDLNENFDEFYRHNENYITALLPDTEIASRLAASACITGTLGADCYTCTQDYLVISDTKPPAGSYFPASWISLYSPWYNELKNGSYYYQKDWETIDHFLLGEGFFNNTGWEFDTARVLNEPPFSTKAGYPYGYKPYFASGISDHLPLLLELKLY
ncbi:MAG: endonuclease/exonuclease/phosphatase family protein [Spirochaetaceae bacterium]|jgi:endonuclease/exonuclease/phosphatase family metal-dependent hydrolase|nr:endonuclease/exonuclease/phosphatase family protein [Spirochaetaceae bacterium]